MHEFPDTKVMTTEHLDALLDEVELRVATDAATMREHEELPHRVATTIRPGNASERHTSTIHAHAVSMRRHDVTCILPAPTGVGDFYHLSFERDRLDIGPQLAVCDRCTMLGEGGFESRFRFLSEVTIPGHPKKTA